MAGESDRERAMIEEEGASADFCNLLLLAECACDVAAQAQFQPLKKPGLPNPPPLRHVLDEKLASSALTFTIPAPEFLPCPTPPIPFKKIYGPGPSLCRRPAPSSLPYKKLRRRHRPSRGWIEASVRLKGTAPMWFGRKLLTATDVGVHFNRLSLPKEAVSSMMASAVMTDAEKRDARQPDRGLPVPVLDRMGRTWQLVLKYWSSSKAHVLHGEWNDLVEKNHLRANVDWVDLWGFRANGPNGLLWLAVV